MSKKKKIIIILSSIFGFIALAFIGINLAGVIYERVRVNNERKNEFVSGDFIYANDEKTDTIYLVGLSDEGKKKDTIVVPFEVNHHTILGFSNVHDYDHDFTTAKTIYLGVINYQSGVMKLGNNTKVYACDPSIYDAILSSDSDLYTSSSTYEMIKRDKSKDLTHLHIADVEFEFSYNGYRYNYVTNVVDGAIQNQLDLPTPYGYFLEGWYNKDKKWDFDKDKVTNPIELKAKWIEADARGFIWKGSTITGCTLVDNKEIVVPKKIEGIEITDIAEKAFANLPLLEKIVIPDTVTRINDYAFKNDINLTTIEFKPKVGCGFGRYVFYKCDSFKEFVIQSNMNFYGGLTFANSSIETLKNESEEYKVVDNMLILFDQLVVALPGKKEYKIPKEVKMIDEYAFYKNNTIESVDLNNTEYVYSYAFYDSTVKNVLCNNANIWPNAFLNTPYLDNQTEDFVILGTSLIKVNTNDNEIIIPKNVETISCALNKNNKRVVIYDNIKNFHDVDLTMVDELIICTYRYKGDFVKSNIFKKDIKIYPYAYALQFFKSDSVFNNKFYAYCNNMYKKNIKVTYKNASNTINKVVDIEFGSKYSDLDIVDKENFVCFMDESGNTYYLNDFISFYEDVSLIAVYK